MDVAAKQTPLLATREFPISRTNHRFVLPAGEQSKPLHGKRTIDLILALLIGVLTIPIQLVGLVVSAVAFRSFPIFSQQRLGLDGQLFTFFKIRSLPASTAAEAPKHDLSVVQNTAAGRFLRKTHLDELLQFWSVVKGDMSIVGPRPEMVGLSETYDPEFVRLRTKVLPGITGLWQISEANEGLIGDAPGYDLYYLKNRSLRLDFWIMARTAQKMAGRPVDFGQLDPARAAVFGEQTAVLTIDIRDQSDESAGGLLAQNRM